MTKEVTMPEAEVLPLKVSDQVEGIAEACIEATFALIAARLELAGYPVSGDFAPEEAIQLEHLFQGFVLRLALNNPTIAAMQAG